MKKSTVRLIACLLSAVLLLCAVGCKKSDKDGEKAPDSNTDTKATLDYSGVMPSDYIKSISYKGLEIALESENASKQNAVWDAVLGSVKIDTYPEEAVNYYFEQTKRLYMESVDNNAEDYLALLERRGITESDMLSEAKALVKKDLALLYITQTEKISVTDAEKSSLFDKYVQRYVDTYGYDKAYVMENMSELIYESMLYDKTTEFLILNNTFKITEA